MGKNRDGAIKDRRRYTAVDITKTLSVREGITLSGRPYVRATGVYPFDAGETFLSGQCFRFDPVKPDFPELFGTDDVYGGVALGRYITVGTPDLDTVVIEGTAAAEFSEVWESYFGFDMDYSGIIESTARRWGENSRIARAADAGRGIRILRQDPWEALCSFIISQNNNIPRIKGIIDRLCLAFGAPIITGGGTEYAFPTPRALYEADADGIARARMGFRAKYVADAAERVTFEPDFLDRVAEAESFDAADGLLRTVKGVGPKVSACTLLFGFCRYEAFPVDVWIRRTVGKYFEDSDPEKIDFGELAPYAGILQQYIFNYERNHRGGD